MRTNGNRSDQRHLRQFLLEEIDYIQSKYVENTGDTVPQVQAKQLKELKNKIATEITQLASQTTADTGSVNDLTAELLATSLDRPNTKSDTKETGNTKASLSHVKDSIADFCDIILQKGLMHTIAINRYGIEHASTKENLKLQLIQFLETKSNEALALLKEKARSHEALAIQDKIRADHIDNALRSHVDRNDPFNLKTYKHFISKSLDKTCTTYQKALEIPYLLTEEEIESTKKDYDALKSIQEEITPIFKSYKELLTKQSPSHEATKKEYNEIRKKLNDLIDRQASDKVWRYASDITDMLDSDIKAKLYPKKERNLSGTLKAKEKLKKILSDNPNSQLINKLSNAETKLEEYNGAKSSSVFSFFFTFAGSNKPARTHMATMLKTIKEGLNTLDPTQQPTTTNIESIKGKCETFTAKAKEITDSRKGFGLFADRLRFWNDGNSTAKMNSVSKLLEDACKTLPNPK